MPPAVISNAKPAWIEDALPVSVSELDSKTGNLPHPSK